MNEFPWTYLLCASLTELKKDESWFWSTEPRIVISLIEEKQKIEKEKMKALSLYIACSVWGKNPDELEKTEKEVLGIDKPVPPQMLKGFF